MAEAVTSPVVNINELKLDSWERGTLYAGADVRIGPMIGVKDLGISYSEVPPGKSGCPFHNHHVEDEMFIILEGEGWGVQLDAELRHEIAPRTQLGIGFRYWYMEVSDGTRRVPNVAFPEVPLVELYSKRVGLTASLRRTW